MVADSGLRSSYRLYTIVVLLFLLVSSELLATEVVTNPSECTTIQSSLKRLTCFDTYFNTPIYLPENMASYTSQADYQPEILKIARRIEKKRPPETASLLVQKTVDHEASGQKRIILSAPAIGSIPPKPLLIISCMNNITRLQIGFEQPLAEHHTAVTLTLDGRSIGGDYLWKIIETGKIVDAGRGIPSINILKIISKHQRLLIQSEAQRLNDLTFDISGLKRVLPEFRKACHW